MPDQLLPFPASTVGRNGILYTATIQKLERWYEHYQALLNQTATVADNIEDCLPPQCQTNDPKLAAATLVLLAVITAEDITTAISGDNDIPIQLRLRNT